ncbi:MAG: hypothetical protein U1F26_04165 [Lysobacterales bacterium]
MSGFDNVAIDAAIQIRETGALPHAAWEDSAKRLLPSRDLQEKGCPKASFLGLCAAGLIRDVPGGHLNGAMESQNAQYAIAAVKILRLVGSASEIDEKLLWTKALKLAKGKEGTSHNQQMNVVLGLARANLLNGIVSS